MAVFSERSALPKETYFDVVSGVATSEVVTATKEGLVRELESDLVMNLGTAISVHLWLREKVEYLRVQLGMSDEEWNRLTGGRR